jgi:hypothetical protein
MKTTIIKNKRHRILVQQKLIKILHQKYNIKSLPNPIFRIPYIRSIPLSFIRRQCLQIISSLSVHNLFKYMLKKRLRIVYTKHQNLYQILTNHITTAQQFDLEHPPKCKCSHNKTIIKSKSYCETLRGNQYKDKQIRKILTSNNKNIPYTLFHMSTQQLQSLLSTFALNMFKQTKIPVQTLHIQHIHNNVTNFINQINSSPISLPTQTINESALIIQHILTVKQKLKHRIIAPIDKNSN